jgi:hypothetical protein
LLRRGRPFQHVRAFSAPCRALHRSRAAVSFLRVNRDSRPSGLRRTALPCGGRTFLSVLADTVSCPPAPGLNHNARWSDNPFDGQNEPKVGGGRTCLKLRRGLEGQFEARKTRTIAVWSSESSAAFRILSERWLEIRKRTHHSSGAEFADTVSCPPDPGMNHNARWSDNPFDGQDEMTCFGGGTCLIIRGRWSAIRGHRRLRTTPFQQSRGNHGISRLFTIILRYICNDARNYL